MKKNLMDTPYRITVPLSVAIDLAEDEELRVSEDIYCKECADAKVAAILQSREYGPSHGIKIREELGGGHLQRDGGLLRCSHCHKRLTSWVRFSKILGTIETEEEWEKTQLFLSNLQKQVEAFREELKDARKTV